MCVRVIILILGAEKYYIELFGLRESETMKVPKKLTMSFYHAIRNKENKKKK